MLTIGIALTLAGLFLKNFFIEYYALVAAAQTFVSGLYAIRNRPEDDPRVSVTDPRWLKKVRSIVRSDVKLSVAFLQLAVLTQSLSVLHPFHPAEPAHPPPPPVARPAEPPSPSKAPFGRLFLA